MNSQTIRARIDAGAIKTWRSIDSTAKWLHNLGIGNAKLDISRWIPEQQGMLL